ncbi:MAG: hypothetical protein ABGY96_10390, partial [bacterium]
QALKMDKVTDTIVVSGEEKTIDKGTLCGIAIERMSKGYKPKPALLIDNKQANIDAWSTHGGIGYLYTTDDAFKRDVATGIDGLARRN